VQSPAMRSASILRAHKAFNFLNRPRQLCGQVPWRT
jgi:hypothetical protein